MGSEIWSLKLDCDDCELMFLELRAKPRRDSVPLLLRSSSPALDAGAPPATPAGGGLRFLCPRPKKLERLFFSDAPAEPVDSRLRGDDGSAPSLSSYVPLDGA